MGNSLGFYVVQYLLFVFNVVFLIAGLNLMGLSVWALLDKVSRMLVYWVFNHVQYSQKR